GWWSRARNVVTWHHSRREPDCPITNSVGTLGMNAYTMPNAKLHVLPVKHRHLLLFCERCSVGLPQIARLGTAVKDSLAIGRLDEQLGLEQPGSIAKFFWFLLTIQQKERHTPEAIALADNTLDLDFRKFGIWHPVDTASVKRNWLRERFALVPFPD